MGKKKKSTKGKGTVLGGRSLGSTRKDPYKMSTWKPDDFNVRPYKPLEFKPITGVTGKERRQRKKK